MEGDVLKIGQYGAPVLIMIFLQMFYKIVPGAVGDRWKSIVAAVFGTLLGVVAVFYNGEAFTVKAIVDYCLSGFMSGLAATGLYEVQRSAIRPRS